MPFRLYNPERRSRQPNGQRPFRARIYGSWTNNLSSYFLLRFRACLEGAFLNVSLVLVLVVVASLIGVGGASLFIYRQMSKDVTVVKPSSHRGRTSTIRLDTDIVAAIAQGLRAHLPSTDPSAHSTRSFPPWPTRRSGTSRSSPTSPATLMSPMTEADNTRASRLTRSSPRNWIPLRLPRLRTTKALDGRRQYDPTQAIPGSHYILNKNGQCRRRGWHRRCSPRGSARSRLCSRLKPLLPTIRNPVPEVRVATPSACNTVVRLFEGDRSGARQRFQSGSTVFADPSCACRSLPMPPTGNDNSGFNAATRKSPTTAQPDAACLQPFTAIPVFSVTLAVPSSLTTPQSLSLIPRASQILL